jgi:steroid 5-alpha reductase family enzyme
MVCYLKVILIPALAASVVMLMTALIAHIPNAPEQVDTIWRVGFCAAMLCFCAFSFVIFEGRKQGKR